MNFIVSLTLCLLPQLPSTPAARVPAEWEPQAAVWMQWPRPYEGLAFEQAFVRIVEVVSNYEEVRILAHDAAVEQRSRSLLSHLPQDRLSWLRVPYNSAWMRDNGPVYLQHGPAQIVQDWGFDAWGGGFGDFPFGHDDRVPIHVAQELPAPLVDVPLIHERGNLEVNGSDTALVNWSVLGHRNPGLTRPAARRWLRRVLGVSSVILVEGFDPEDGTRGHIDGIARFISPNEIVVPTTGPLSDSIAAQISQQRPDLTVHRPSGWLDVNWLVGDGYVVTGSTGLAQANAVVRALLESYFPGRDVHLIPVFGIYQAGGGIHCVTNDQPIGGPQ